MPNEQCVHSGRMTQFQIMAVGICLMINFLDGFDVLAIAFAAPAISSDWSLNPTELGTVFSAGLAGMVLGALFLSPFADRVGRRPMILTCLCVIGIGMLGSAATVNINQLIVMRLLTGIGVGGMLSSLTTMVAEYSSDQRRKLAISILQAGYPVGAIIAGVASVYLLEEFGWRAIFIVGGSLSLIMLPLVHWRLPESVDFLLAKRPADALVRINKIMATMGQSSISELPPAQEHRIDTRPLLELFSQAFRSRTIAIWSGFIVLMSAFYFVTNWTPSILIDSGLASDAAISGGVLMAVGGVLGGLLLGWLSGRFSVNRIGAFFMLMSIVSMTVFGFLDVNVVYMLCIAFLIGFFLAGSIICLYTIIPDLYPVRIRNTATGWALGIGRLGGVIGPFFAGLLIELDWERSAYYFVLALPIVVAIVAVLNLSHASKRQEPL